MTLKVVQLFFFVFKHVVTELNVVSLYNILLKQSS